MEYDQLSTDKIEAKQIFGSRSTDLYVWKVVAFLGRNEAPYSLEI